MKISEVQRQYAFEITVEQFKKILKRDEATMENAYKISMANSSQHGYQTLSTTLLNQIGELEKVDYDAHFGPYIYATVQQPCRPNTLQEIERIIADYVG